MDIKQSFILAISKVRLSLYEQRILIKMIEYGQQRLKGLWLRDNMKKLPHEYDNVKFAVPVKYILSEGSQHYEQVYDAARSLCSRRFEFEDDKKKTWHVTSLIYNVTLKKRSGVLQFYASRTFFDVLYDFSRGYCQYDLETVLTLPSPYAVRFYILMNGQSFPLTMTIQNLKEMFGVQDKYSQTADFIKKVIEPSKAALDLAKTNSFTYTRVTHGQKVTALTFTPVKRQPLSEQQLMAKQAVSMLLTEDLKRILIIECNFTIKELGAHKQLLERLAKHEAALDILSAIVERARKGRKQKGYIINAIKSELGIPRINKQRQDTAPAPTES